MKNRFLKVLSFVMLFAVSFSFLVPSANAARVIKPAYDYKLIHQESPSLTMAPGEIRDIWMEVKNTGTATWSPPISATHEGFVFLGTGSVYDNEGRGKDYYSNVYYEGHDCGDPLNPGMSGCESWYSSNRPAEVSPVNIKPGYHARFQFKIKAPQNPGIYREYFTPVAEGITWMKDIGIYWEINVTREKSNSFDYRNMSISKNIEINENTTTVVSPEQQLVFDALKNNIDYKSFSGNVGLNIDFKFSPTLIAQSKQFIDEYNTQLKEMKIPLDLAAQSGRRFSFSMNSENKNIIIKNPSEQYSKDYVKSGVNLESRDSGGAVSKLFNSEVEYTGGPGDGTFIKINQFNLLDNYFNYANPGKWYQMETTPSCDNEFDCSSRSFNTDRETYDVYKSDTTTFLEYYSKAIARDLNHSGIILKNEGAENVGNENCEKISIELNKDNVNNYWDLVNETSYVDQYSIDQFKQGVDQYLAKSNITLWINPASKVIKKLSVNINTNKNEAFDEFSVGLTYVLNAYNDSNIVINMPTTYSNINELDLGTKLQEKISPVRAMAVRASAVARSWERKAVSGTKRIINYLSK